MEAIRIQRVVDDEGKVVITGLPYKKGQLLDVFLVPHLTSVDLSPRLTVR